LLGKGEIFRIGGWHRSIIVKAGTPVAMRLCVGSGQARADQVGYIEGQNPDRRQLRAARYPTMFWTNSKKVRSARSQSAPVRLLLDTQIALESQLKKARLLMDKADAAFGSAKSEWEIAIKASHGCIRPILE
jgi:hypothetical protein